MVSLLFFTGASAACTVSLIDGASVSGAAGTGKEERSVRRHGTGSSMCFMEKVSVEEELVLFSTPEATGCPVRDVSILMAEINWAETKTAASHEDPALLQGGERSQL